MNRPSNPLSKTILPSGLTVIIETLPYVRSVALGYYLRTGSAVESEEHGGASHFLEHLVFKGTKQRSTAELAKVIDILGGDVDAFTGKEYTSFYAHVLDEQLPTAMDLLTEIVTSPRFNPDDVEMERGVILEEIKMVEDTPDDLVHEVFVTAFWPDHPLGRPILGTEETIASLQRAKIIEHYEETFQPSNVIFAASGNLKPEDVLPFLEKKFPVMDRAPFRREWGPPKPYQHVIIREKKELEQVHLCLGSRGYPQQGEERYAAALLNAVLGGGMSSRLFQRMREQEGLVYCDRVVSQRLPARRLSGGVRRVRAEERVCACSTRRSRSCARSATKARRPTSWRTRSCTSKARSCCRWSRRPAACPASRGRSITSAGSTRRTRSSSTSTR